MVNVKRIQMRKFSLRETSCLHKDNERLAGNFNAVMRKL